MNGLKISQKWWDYKKKCGGTKNDVATFVKWLNIVTLWFSNFTPANACKRNVKKKKSTQNGYSEQHYS